MRHQNPDLLLYIAMADAYAMSAEFTEGGVFDEVLRKCLLFDRYVAHSTFHEFEPGRYTDDTEMSVANAKVLLETAPFTRSHFADAYVAEFQFGGSRRGYSSNFYDLLSKVTNGEELLKSLRPESNKNGAAMRSMVLGVIPDLCNMLEVARLQACITHDSPEGIWSAEAVAIMSHFTLHEDAPLSEIGEYVIANLPEMSRDRFAYVFRTPWRGMPVREYDGVSIAETTVHAVARLVTHHLSLMDMLGEALRWGGDTDSVAAIAWGIASTRYQDEKIPRFMLENLEPGHPETGVEYLRDLGTRLMNKYAN